MEEFFTVISNHNPKIKIKVAAGHFATESAHRSHYIDIFDLKSNASMAKTAALELAAPYLGSTLADVIVYMDGTGVLAAYLADELLQAGPGVVNEGGEIHIVKPMISADGHYIFHKSVMEMIKNKNVILMAASMSTGASVNAVHDCLDYYNCKLAGISAIFAAVPEICGHQINSLFTINDIPDYRFYNPSECLMCKTGKKLDAIINSEGYTKI